MGPREVRVVRYRAQGIKKTQAPYKVVVRLLHRSRDVEMARAACRGISTSDLAQGTDPCVRQPVTEIARATAFTSPPPELDWQRLYNYGRGLAGDVQERLHLAAEVLERSLELTPKGSRRARAKVHLALGRVQGRLGRIRQAAEQFDRAEKLVGKRPAIERARGISLSAVWRFSAAARALSGVDARDLVGIRERAIVLGSMNQQRRALSVARQGLVHYPRDAALMRVQALALVALNPGSHQAKLSMEAYLRYRKHDRSMSERKLAADRSATILNAQQPIPEYELMLP